MQLSFKIFGRHLKSLPPAPQQTLTQESGMIQTFQSTFKNHLCFHFLYQQPRSGFTFILIQTVEMTSWCADMLSLPVQCSLYTTAGFVFLSIGCGHHFFFLIEVQLIYSVVLVSGVQQIDSVLYVYIYTHIYMYVHIHIYILFRSFSIMVYYKVLNIVPVLYNRTLLFIYFIYSSVYILIPNS